MLTTDDLNLMAEHPDFAGFGYIGARRNMLTGPWDPECHTPEESRALVAKADAQILGRANDLGLTAEELFTQWANQKIGRWYGDCWFGNDGHHAETCLPNA